MSVMTPHVCTERLPLTVRPLLSEAAEIPFGAYVVAVVGRSDELLAILCIKPQPEPGEPGDAYRRAVLALERALDTNAAAAMGGSIALLQNAGDGTLSRVNYSIARG